MNIFTKSMASQSLIKKWRLGEKLKKSICMNYKKAHYIPIKMSNYLSKTSPQPLSISPAYRLPCNSEHLL